MTTPNLKHEIDDLLTKSRNTLDRMKIDARLLRADLRDKKDATLAELESSYDDLKNRAAALADDAGKEADALVQATRAARDTFQAKLAAARAKETSSSST